MSLKITFNTGKRLDSLRAYYPVSSLVAIFTSLILMYIVHNEAGSLFKWPLTGFIGFFAFFNLETVHKRYILSARLFSISCISILILLFFFYRNIPLNYTEKLTPFWFFTIGLGVILHFTATLVPCITRGHADVYIPYNVRLFVCWTQASLYAVLLYVLLLLAILALQALFGLQSNPNIPITLFILVSGIFIKRNSL